MRKMVLYKFLHVFCCLLMYIKRSESVTFKRFSVVADSGMQNSVSTLSLYSGIACGVRCKDEDDCASYSYTSSTKTCTLNDKAPYSAPSEVISSIGNTLYLKDCESGWSAFKHSCYLLSIIARGCDSAMTYCESVGASLLVVETNDEHQHIREIISSTGASFWIGARYSHTAGVFQWVDGTDVTLNGWRPGMPGLNKGCVDYLSHYDQLWNPHWDCTNTPLPFICEKSR